MDFHSVMETFAEAWVAANTHTPLTEAAEQGLISGPPGIGYGPFLPSVPPDSERHDREASPDIGYHARQNGDTSSSDVGFHGRQSAETSSDLGFHGRQSAESSSDVGFHGRQSGESSSETGFHGRQSPSDTQHSCTLLGDLRPPSKHLLHPNEISKAKQLPVHCVVEQIPGPQVCGQYVELDSYAIIPCDTLFNELVRTALVKLGYSDKQILGAKGSIQIKNWKPLAFDQITENPEATLVDILGDLATMATLHVRLYSVPDSLQEWMDATVRNAVLELLREMSQSKLAKLCPLSQPMLSNIINNRYIGKIGKDKCQEFGKWYLNYRKQHPEGPVPEIVPCDRPLDGRLTFHPTKELPMMRDWFQSCRNPSRRTLQVYVDLLNQGPVRQQERPKVALMTVKNWWKNEKQRERKQKSESTNSDDPIRKRKKKSPESKEDSPKEDSSCDGHLQELQVADPRNLTVLNHKSNFSDNCGDMVHELNVVSKKTDYLMLQPSPTSNKHNMLPHHIIESPSDSNSSTTMFQKLSSSCDSQNQGVFNSMSDSFFNDHENHKMYCCKVMQEPQKAIEKTGNCAMCNTGLVEVDV